MNEMKARGYHPDETWYNVNWRGSTIGEMDGWAAPALVNHYVEKTLPCGSPMIYDEHDDKYLQECLENLRGKGIEIQF
jgi:uncharacterized protein (TIGR02328 family)